MENNSFPGNSWSPQTITIGCNKLSRPSLVARVNIESLCKRNIQYPGHPSVWPWLCLELILKKYLRWKKNTKIHPWIAVTSSTGRWWHQYRKCSDCGCGWWHVLQMDTRHVTSTHVATKAQIEMRFLLKIRAKTLKSRHFPLFDNLHFHPDWNVIVK